MSGSLDGGPAEPGAAGGAAAAEIDYLLSGLADPILHAVALYWRSKLRPGRLPGRGDLDPVEIPALLSRLYLIEAVGAPIRLRHRLIGTQIAEWAGRDATGTYVDEVDYGPHRDALLAEYRSVMARGLPRRDDLDARWPNPDFKFYTRLLLPLASDGRRVDMLLGALNTHNGPIFRSGT